MDFMGAAITKSVGMNGSANFHYDESLALINLSLITTSWDEIRESVDQIVANNLNPVLLQ